ncbi:MAG: DNA-3-methyladenine glycosylase [Bacteroidota bacterium]|nr:DNA-3-methyladenine glycosylase [Bacteroidota bacterium]
MKLGRDFYIRENVVSISKDLIGKYLFSFIDGVLTGGMIVETEAYSGHNDKACHAHQNRRTKRTEIMYQEGGVAYVYLCYGLHYLFNIITNIEGKADAVLIRAIQPTEGIAHMQQRRNFFTLKPQLTAGPGVTSQALGINNKHYGQLLLEDTIWLEDHNVRVLEDHIIAGPRVGIAYAEEDALLPWRFRLVNNIWTSKAK